MKRIIYISMLFCSLGIVQAQQNIVETVVPFLTLSPDARASAMGDIGVATSPDANSMHWNPAKYAFVTDDFGIGGTYTPWLSNLVDDIYLASLSGYKRMDPMQSIGYSLKYFSYGDITFTDNRGGTIATKSPSEFTMDAAYARKFSETFSMGLSFRFIYSNITGGINSNDAATENKPAITVATDISAYYVNDIEIQGSEADLSFGMNISNIGPKISYQDNEQSYFIPTTLRLGSALKYHIDSYNTITGSIELSKLLVPTPPIYGDAVNGVSPIEEGYDPNVPVFTGMIRSFYDAPDGMSEELKEIMYGFGAEWFYRNQFALRGGYFHESDYKGNRKYATMGLGITWNVLTLDVSYLFSVSGKTNPLDETLRIGLLFNVGAKNKASKPVV